MAASLGLGGVSGEGSRDRGAPVAFASGTLLSGCRFWAVGILIVWARKPSVHQTRRGGTVTEGL